MKNHNISIIAALRQRLSSQRTATSNGSRSRAKRGLGLAVTLLGAFIGQQTALAVPLCDLNTRMMNHIRPMDETDLLAKGVTNSYRKWVRGGADIVEPVTRNNDFKGFAIKSGTQNFATAALVDAEGNVRTVISTHSGYGGALGIREQNSVHPPAHSLETLSIISEVNEQHGGMVGGAPAEERSFIAKMDPAVMAQETRIAEGSPAAAEYHSNVTLYDQVAANGAVGDVAVDRQVHSEVHLAKLIELHIQQIGEENFRNNYASITLYTERVVCTTCDPTLQTLMTRISNFHTDFRGQISYDFSFAPGEKSYLIPGRDESQVFGGAVRYFWRDLPAEVATETGNPLSLPEN